MASAKNPNHYRPSSPDFHREEFPFYWIARVHGMYTLEMERALKTIGCDIPTWRVLAILQQQGTSSISEIATHAIAKLSTVTKMVYRMKAEGLVTTATSANDGRVTEVTITPEGERVLARIGDATSGLFERSFRGLTPTRIAKLNELLQVIFGNLDR